MIFTPADQTAIIAAIGETITLNGVSVVADFRLESQPVQLFDGSIMSSSPVARITAAEHAANAVDYGTLVTARGIDYSVSEIRQEQSGLMLLVLVSVDAAIAPDLDGGEF